MLTSWHLFYAHHGTNFVDVLGLFHLCKLPCLNSLISHFPETLDLAFKLKRKKFLIEVLKLTQILLSTYPSFLPTLLHNQWENAAQSFSSILINFCSHRSCTYPQSCQKLPAEHRRTKSPHRERESQFPYQQQQLLLSVAKSLKKEEDWLEEEL